MDKEYTPEEAKAWLNGYNEGQKIRTPGTFIHISDNQTAESARPWVGLTDAELGELYHAGWSTNMDFARGIERVLKEKNT